MIVSICFALLALLCLFMAFLVWPPYSLAIFLYWMTRRLKTRFIYREDGGFYLLRARLRGWMPGDEKTYRWSAYLHKFYSHDVDMAPHNHPWRWSISIPLCGGYIEERRCADGTIRIRRVRPFIPNFFGRDTFHRIAMLHGPEVWTLFICGPKFQGWGFWDAVRGFIPWRDRLRERGIEGNG